LSFPLVKVRREAEPRNQGRRRDLICSMVEETKGRLETLEVFFLVDHRLDGSMDGGAPVVN